MKKIRRVIISIMLSTVMVSSFLPGKAVASGNFNTAVDLKLNEMHSDSLVTEDEVDYFKFTTSNNDSFYKVELRNTKTTDIIDLTLYSENDATTNVYDFMALVGDANSDTRKLEPNHTYYIDVQESYCRRSMGDYKICVTEIKDDVANDFSNSTSIKLNEKKSYDLEALGDSDYFKFTTTSNDSFYNIEIANTEATDSISATLFYEDDITTDELDISAYKARKDSKNVKLEPNHTYYVVVQPSDSYYNPTGGYKLCVTEIKDDAPDTFKKCPKILLNKKSTYKLNVDGDIDYFKFKTTKTGVYTITFANKSMNESAVAYIYGDDDITQKKDMIYAYKAEKGTIKIKLKGNHDYYIGVEKRYSFYSVVGEYSLTIRN